MLAVIMAVSIQATASFAVNPGDPGAQDSTAVQDNGENTDPANGTEQNQDSQNGQNSQDGQRDQNGQSNQSDGSGSSDNTGNEKDGDQQKDTDKESGKKNEKGKDAIKEAAKSAKLKKEDEDKVIELEGQIEQMEREMATFEAQLKEIQNKIDLYKKRAKSLSKKMSKTEKEMGQRLRTMYKSGSVGFVDVVLNSNSVSDMISNVDMVKRIYKSDRKAVSGMEKDYKALIEEEKELKKAKKQQKEIYAKQLEKMDEQNDTIIASASLFANAAGSYKGEKLLWPCPSSHSISSKFGYRICPFHGRELHRGIDIPTYTGANIIAAFDGIVIRSTYSSGYGNYVMISHGGGLATLYAHNSRLVAKVGQKVKKGQVIAKAGSTGPSTGTHCHFEVQMNGKLVNPMSLLK